jgi:hypothetical protein
MADYQDPNSDGGGNAPGDNWFDQNPPPAATAGAFSYDDLNALYQKYLHRSASQDEYQSWLSGTYGPPNLQSIDQQIASSDEAQRVAGTGRYGPPAAPTPSAPVVQPPAPPAPALLANPTGNTYQPPLYVSNPNAPAPPAPMAPYVAPVWTGGDFIEPTKPAEIATPYHLPTQAELEASPGYLARMAMGQQALERSAAARGTVLSGGTQKALNRYGQDYASNEYGNLVGQTLAARTENVGEYNTGRTNAFQDYLTKYGQFVDRSNAEFGARTQNIAEQQMNYGNQLGMYNAENARTLNDYLTNTGIQRTSANDYWQRLLDLYSPGAQLAGGSYKPGVGTA